MKAARAAASSPVLRSRWVSDGESDGAGADGVAADAARHEDGRHRLGEANDAGLGRAIDKAVWHAPHARRHRGDVDDRATTGGHHAGQPGADDAVHGREVDFERPRPVPLVAVEDRPVVHIANGVNDHVEPRAAGVQRLDGAQGRWRPASPYDNGGVRPAELRQRRLRRCRPRSRWAPSRDRGRAPRGRSPRPRR